MKTKRCRLCRRSKALTTFTANCKAADGRLNTCKQCDARRRREKYASDPRTRAIALWHCLLQRINNANGKNPSYGHVDLRLSRDEFVRWFVAELPKFTKRYGAEVTPSIDRTNSKGHYAISNMRLLPLLENSNLAERKKNLRAPPGLAWCGKCAKYLPKENFYKNKAQPHGLEHSCKRHKRLRS